jgi:cell division septation protein DedD
MRRRLSLADLINPRKDIRGFQLNAKLPEQKHRRFFAPLRTIALVKAIARPALITVAILSGTTIGHVARAQTAPSDNGYKTGAAAIPGNLPATARTAQNPTGPLGLFPFVTPNRTKDSRPTSGAVSLSDQYRQKLSGKPVHPHKPTRPAKMAPATARQKTKTLGDHKQEMVAATANKPQAKSRQTVTAPQASTQHKSIPGDTPFAIQLGAFRTEISAKTYWASFKIRYPALADTYHRHLSPVTVQNKGQFHRLRLSGFGSMNQAKRTCRQLATDGTACIATRN